jgi:hypothetical protein
LFHRKKPVFFVGGRAKIYKMNPFTIILLDRTLKESAFQDLHANTLPGSSATEAILVLGQNTIDPSKDQLEQADKDPKKDQAAQALEGILMGRVVRHLMLLVLFDRAGIITEKMLKRRNLRPSRRNRNYRHRPPRFDNHRRKKGPYAPSLQHLVDGVINLIKNLMKYVPTGHISMELVKFDIQKMENSQISGKNQQGELYKANFRAYVMDRSGYKCVYCGKEKCVLQLARVRPKSMGGSDRPSNLVGPDRKSVV